MNKEYTSKLEKLNNHINTNGMDNSLELCEELFKDKDIETVANDMIKHCYPNTGWYYKTRAEKLIIRVKANRIIKEYPTSLARRANTNHIGENFPVNYVLYMEMKAVMDIANDFCEAEDRSTEYIIQYLIDTIKDMDGVTEPHDIVMYYLEHDGVE